MQPQMPDLGAVMFQALWAWKWLFLFVLGIACLKPIVRLLRPRVKGWAGEVAVRKRLDALGYPHVDDVYLPSLNGVTQVDHVARVGGALVVLETKNYAGRIVPRKSVKWDQYLAGGRVKSSFLNPLHQNHGHVRSVEEAIRSAAPVLGLVVFVGDATFSGEMPLGVIRLRDLKAVLENVRRASPEISASREAWATLTRLHEATDRGQSRTVHRRTHRAAKARGDARR